MNVDGLSAAASLRPAGPEELAAQLQEASAKGEAVIPIGGGRALGLGDPPRRFDIALETAGLDRIIEHSLADLVVTVEAGVTVEKLNAELAKAGQFLPIDPYGAPGHTIGGVLAAGLSGPLRLRYGSARDFLIGLRVALPDGRLVSSGGRVVKNVSGYDMNKLHHGALGSLGVIVAASFKVFPRPLHEQSLRTSPSSLEAARAQSRRALDLPMEPIALVMESVAGGYQLTCRLAGTRAAVERMAGELGWEPVDAGWDRHARRASSAWARISVPPLRLEAALDGLPEGAEWIALPGVGLAHWLNATDAAALRSLRARAEALGGGLVLMAASPDLKHDLGVWGAMPATLDLMRRFKAAFDPSGTLSPGRFVI